MQRLLVALLAAVDAAVAAAVGLVVLLAPLTVLWAVAFGGGADWGSLWPVAGTLWQFAHGAALSITVPDAAVSAVGLDPAAASFSLSLMPLAFLAFTVLFAARSGVRAATAGAWMTGVLSGTSVFASIAVAVALTAPTALATVSTPLAILFPALAYFVGALCGAVGQAWADGDRDGIIDRLHDRVDTWGDWAPVLGASVRGASVAVVSLLGFAALGVAAMLLLRGGEVVALFGSARADALGVTVFSLAHLAYLPTLLVWALAWMSGPGFAVGIGTAVSPAGTELGVVPGVPILGLLPETSSFWALVVVLVPVAAGALAGWTVRSRLVWDGQGAALLPRVAISGGIAAGAAGVAAVLAALATGSIGPGRMAVVGPHPGWTALAVGVEVLIGAGILMLAPRNREELAEERTDRWAAEMGTLPTQDPPLTPATPAADENATEPLDDVDLGRSGSRTSID